MSTIDSTRCPLCQQDNLCAMEMAKATGKEPERCWCVDMAFTPELLAKVPLAAKDKACVCQACAAQFSHRN